MANIVNFGQLGGGFRHFQGLLPANLGSGDPFHASTKIFHVAATNAAAIFRGDIVTWADSAHGVQGASDLPFNIGPPSASLLIGNGGGTLLGNASIAPNAARWAPGDTTAVIAGVVVGFAPITLYQAKNGFQFIPALTEAWLTVETDPDVEMYATVPTVPGTAFNLLLGGGVDVKANAGQANTRFGGSGLSIDPATFANTATLPLRAISSGEQIGDDPTSAGFVGKFVFNRVRHWRGSAGLIAD